MRGWTPVVLQSEASECGLAAVAMVAAANGRPVALAQLRAQCTPAERAPTLAGLAAAADALGIATRPVRVRLAELRRLHLPAVLHWQFDHFVVVTRVNRQVITIHDPACGRRRVAMDEVSRAFTGVAIECRVFARPQNIDANSRLTLWTMLRTYSGLLPYLGVMLTLLVTTQIFALAPPIATQLLIDEIVLGQDQTWRDAVLLAIGLILVAKVGLETLRRWFALYTGTRLAQDSTTAVVQHLFSLPAETILKRQVGDLVSRIESLRPIRAALIDTCATGIVQAVMLSSTLAVMALYSGTLTLASVGMLVIGIGVHVITLPRSRSLSLEALVAQARASNLLIDTLRGFETIQALGLGPQRLQHWQAHFMRGTNATARVARLGIAASAGHGLTAAADQLLFLGIGLAKVVDGTLTLGVLFAFLALRGRLAGAMFGLLGVLRELYLLRPHVERVGEILEERGEVTPASAVSRPMAGRLRCDNIAYRYPGEGALLDGFYADIGAGEFVVITGTSGCGKSTLLRLLAGSLRPQVGRILVDDLDLRLWKPVAVRQQIGIVMQNDRLFAGSLADNISCFDTVPDIDRIREVALIAAVWRDIEALPMGLHTPISGACAALSGGQAQRILIARALYRRPRVLLLDEATNQLDRQTEHRVLTNLRAQAATIVAVAHGPQVVEHAQRIIRLDAVEPGATRSGMTTETPGGPHGNSAIGIS